jgi:hypothetical protein
LGVRVTRGWWRGGRDDRSASRPSDCRAARAERAAQTNTNHCTNDDRNRRHTDMAAAVVLGGGGGGCGGATYRFSAMTVTSMFVWLTARDSYGINALTVNEITSASVTSTMKTSTAQTAQCAVIKHTRFMVHDVLPIAIFNCLFVCLFVCLIVCLFASFVATFLDGWVSGRR